MGDVLELCEVSLNYNLVGGRVRFRFQDTPLLQGISLHEAWGSLVVLVPTVGSVHKLTFPHPSRQVETIFSSFTGLNTLQFL
jgi:nuclear pore complex protein Nup160